LNTVGNIVLIPLIGIVGAAISTALSELFLVAMLIYGLRPVCGMPRITRRLFIGAAGAGVIVAIWRIFPDLHFLAFIPLAAVAYIGTLLMFKTIREHEIPMAMAILSGKASR
jgi:O-antigen/teichoic acid export membrane protein